MRPGSNKTLPGGATGGRADAPEPLSETGKRRAQGSVTGFQCR